MRRTAEGVEITVIRPAHVECTQRRRELRQPLHVSTKIRKARGPRGARPDVAILVELSAVGAKIECFSPFADGEIVEIDVPTGKDGGCETVSALVLKCVPAPEAVASEKKRFEARLEFDDGNVVRLSRQTRDEIAAFVFEQHRLSLKLRRLVESPVMYETKKNRILANILAWMRAPSNRWKH
jgi:hypothetical protein